MKVKQKQSGFSLVEVLMAAGILSIGMLLVATMFPLGMHLTAVASERTMAAIVADQAFAKIQLYGVDVSLLTDVNCADFNEVSDNLIDANEFAYPPTNPIAGSRSQYYWSALCRKVNSDPLDRSVQVIVFVSRKRGAGLTYNGGASSIPVPVKVNINWGTNNDELDIATAGDETLINLGSTVVNNATGQMYRVIDRQDDLVTLDRDWQGGISGVVWVIAPPVAGGADPAIAIFQKIIKF